MMIVKTKKLKIVQSFDFFSNSSAYFSKKDASIQSVFIV